MAITVTSKPSKNDFMTLCKKMTYDDRLYPHPSPLWRVRYFASLQLNIMSKENLEKKTYPFHPKVFIDVVNYGNNRGYLRRVSKRTTVRARKIARSWTKMTWFQSIFLFKFSAFEVKFSDFWAMKIGFAALSSLVSKNFLDQNISPQPCINLVPLIGWPHLQ
jgi:hypothetical protein